MSSIIKKHLKNINKFIVENDYVDMDHKIFVDILLKEKGLTRIYYMPNGCVTVFIFFMKFRNDYKCRIIKLEKKYNIRQYYCIQLFG